MQSALRVLHAQEVSGPDYEFLRKSEWLCFPELDDWVEVFTKLGVSRIGLNSGEPMLRPSLTKCIYHLKHVHKINDTAITTNGLRLAERGRGLIEAGLDRSEFRCAGSAGRGKNEWLRNTMDPDQKKIEMFYFGR
jgi:hypothetical protein